MNTNSTYHDCSSKFSYQAHLVRFHFVPFCTFRFQNFNFIWQVKITNWNRFRIIRNWLFSIRILELIFRFIQLCLTNGHFIAKIELFSYLKQNQMSKHIQEKMRDERWWTYMNANLIYSKLYTCVYLHSFCTRCRIKHKTNKKWTLSIMITKPL